MTAFHPITPVPGTPIYDEAIAKGWITEADLATPSSADWNARVPPRAYVCGPTAFVDHVIGRLLTLGYTNRTIRAERFGPSGA